VKILIVDDDRTCRELLRAILEPYARCDQAVDGAEAVDAVRLALEDDAPYDLICLDIMMPGTDGHQALQEIRALERRYRIGGSDGAKVMMTTALVDSKHCIRSFKEGCEDYYTKPIKADDFLRHVRKLVGDMPLRSSCEATEDATPAHAAAEAPAGEPPPRRFLIVDDDAVCRELLGTMLRPYGRCNFAHDGREAVDAVRIALDDNDPYDMICLDIMMPGTNGHEALTEIRALEARRGIYGSDGVKVIMITALCDSKHCVQSFKEGCEYYITKPITEEELFSKMRELGLFTPAEAAP